MRHSVTRMASSHQLLALFFLSGIRNFFMSGISATFFSLFFLFSLFPNVWTHAQPRLSPLQRLLDVSHDLSRRVLSSASYILRYLLIERRVAACPHHVHYTSIVTIPSMVVLPSPPSFLPFFN